MSAEQGSPSTVGDRAGLADLVAGRLADIPDFPEPGVVFKDFTPLLADPAVFGAVVRDLADRYSERVDAIVGIEARGFMIGAAAAYELRVPFVPVRKAGKLPRDTYARSFTLEYGQATLEIHRDCLAPGSRVLVIDDVLATGGTAEATCELVEATGGTVVAVDVILELSFLGGRDRLAGREVSALLTE